MSKNYLDNLTEMIFNAPLWVQEVIFTDMRKRLEEKFENITNTQKEEDIYPAYTPTLTFKGKKELETHDHGYDFNFYRCLTGISQGLRVIDITLNNFWTLEETSLHLAEGIKNELIQTPQNPVVSAIIFYLGNQIRLGEYVKRLDKINVKELDDVLRKQKIHNEENPNSKMKIGELLVNMGYVANQDIDKILYIKDESKKRFIVSTNNAQTSTSQTNTINQQELLQRIQKLTQENNLLKEKLRAIFNIQNKKK